MTEKVKQCLDLKTSVCGFVCVFISTCVHMHMSSGSLTSVLLTVKCNLSYSLFPVSRRRLGCEQLGNAIIQHQ